MHYLYKITNQLNEKVYIGQTIDDKNRWHAHKSFAKQALPVQYIHRAMAKYSSENFEFEVIATCRTQEDADETEKMLIIQYDSQNKESGYNISHGGDQVWNRGLPREQQPMYGKHHSEESRKKISASNMGKDMPHKTEEQKKYMSNIMKGRILTDEWKNKIGQARKGIKHSEESRKKMSVSQKGNQAGEKHPGAKLTAEIVKSIRCEYYVGNITMAALGRKYNVSGAMISNIVKNKNWKM